MTESVLSPSPAIPQVESATATKSTPLSMMNVSKRYHQGGSMVEALKDVSFSVRSGEFVAIMGASGSGKSTLLHVAAGLTSIDGGQVSVDDVDLSKLGDRKLTHFRRRRIGLMFQSFNLIPALTAEENISLPLMTDGRTEPLKKLDQLLDRLGISARRKHRPDAMSGGEQQRVALARALITDPALILADEPTGSLDSVSGQGICRLLRELSQQEGRTIVVVTHEPAVAIWAERVMVMRDGKSLTEFATGDFQDAQSLAAHYQHVVNSPKAD
ncbi:MAG TPA: ABC transporter ATP-binding protein [Schlesneria sp.]